MHFSPSSHYRSKRHRGFNAGCSWHGSGSRAVFATRTRESLSVLVCFRVRDVFLGCTLSFHFSLNRGIRVPPLWALSHLQARADPPLESRTTELQRRRRARQLCSNANKSSGTLRRSSGFLLNVSRQSTHCRARPPSPHATDLLWDAAPRRKKNVFRRREGVAKRQGFDLQFDVRQW